MPAVAKKDRLERLTNLVLVLLDASRPVTLREIGQQVGGYPREKGAARQAFERDKRALRDLGIPVTAVPVASPEQVGYVIRAEDYYLPELELDEAEGRALSFAVAAVQLGGEVGRDALSALGHSAPPAALSPVAVLPSAPALATAHEALKHNALLTFGYHGRKREVEPYGLAFKAARWYLVARDRTLGRGEGAAVRTFRVDRIEGAATMGEPGSFAVPPDFDLSSEIRLLAFASEASDAAAATLRVDARMARLVAALLPTSGVTSFDDEGGVLLEVPVSDTEAFLSFVAGLGDTAVVVSPPELRQLVVERMRKMAASAPTNSTARVTGRPREAVDDPLPDGPPSRQLFVGERLRRLLAVLVYLARVGEASITELAGRFGLGEEELVHDLELAACCGLPPYTPDQLIELVVDSDRVTAYGVGQLAKPRRLTPEEGFALSAAGKALLEVPGAGDEASLRSALQKLDRVLGEPRFSLELEPPRWLGDLRAAVDRRETLEIEYVTSRSPRARTRRVDPYQVVLREGSWYLDAWCHTAGGLRRFQAERVQAVRATGETFDAPDELDDALSRPQAFVGGPESVAATIAVRDGMEHALEQVAAGPVERLSDGRVAVPVLVADPEGWLGRLLLRLGPSAEVLSPESLRNAGRLAAERVLLGYGEH
jgi:proteasome accessory factor C